MTWDALVIGAGPAGSVTARELARRGRRVLLVDKATFPRAKVCGCCLNGAAIETLERLGLGHVLAGGVPLDRVTIAAGPRSAEVRLKRGVAISREIFDMRLIDAAVREGVEFRPGIMNPSSSREMKVSEIEANVVIVASGLTGGDATPKVGSRIGGGVVLAASASPAFFAPGSIYMATGRSGYVGLVRVEDDRLDIAAAFDPAFVKSSGGLGLAAESILREVGWPVPLTLQDTPWKGTPALTRRSSTLAGHRSFVVGDAAGYVEPFTGEGMAWALMSAEALAPLAAQDWHPGLIRKWKSTYCRVVGRRQRVCRIVSQVLRSPILTSLAVRALSVMPQLANPVVAAINRPSPLPNVVPT